MSEQAGRFWLWDGLQGNPPSPPRGHSPVPQWEDPTSACPQSRDV